MDSVVIRPLPDRLVGVAVIFYARSLLLAVVGWETGQFLLCYGWTFADGRAKSKNRPKFAGLRFSLCLLETDGPGCRRRMPGYVHLANGFTPHANQPSDRLTPGGFQALPLTSQSTL